MPLLEGLSALSRAHAFGNLRTGMLPDSVRQWTEMNVSLLAFGLRGAQDISTDLEHAGTLRQAIADGQLSPEFLGLLADSIGVNAQAIEQRLAERKADGVVGNETNTDASLPAALADASFAIAPLGPGKRQIHSAPNILDADDSAFRDLPPGTSPNLWRSAWKQWETDHRQTWRRTIHLPEGPIQISSVTAREVGEIRRQDPRHHFEAAAILPQLLEHSVLASIDKPNESKPGVEEVHRRYAWMRNSDGEVRHVLMTVLRWKGEKVDKDTAYSVETLEVMEPVKIGTAAGNLGRQTRPTAAHAASGDTGNLDQFLSGIKLEHRFDSASSSTSAKSHPPLDPSKLTDLIDTDSETSFSIGTEPSSSDSEARINEATVEARKKVAAADAESIRRAGRFWLSLHGEKGVSQLPELKGKDMRSLVDEAKQTFPNLKFFHWQDGDTDVTRLHDGVGEAEISVRDGKVWVDTTRAGGLGSSSPAKWATRAKASMAPAVYQIAQAYARNNGLQFIPDPYGVSTIATFRRWPHLLSSAIRMGDTSHIGGAKDVEGWKEGDHEHNAGLLALHEYEHVRHFFPEIDHLHLSEDSSTIVDDAGAPVSDSTLADLLTGERHPERLGIGETTLRRAIVTGQTAAEGRMESRSEAGTGEPSERRIHPGAVQDFVPDLGSGDSGARPRRHTLDGISYSIGHSTPSGDPPSAKSKSSIAKKASAKKAAKKKGSSPASPSSSTGSSALTSGGSKKSSAGRPTRDATHYKGELLDDAWFENKAREATMNPHSNTVVLGKYDAVGLSYEKVAQSLGATYFQLNDWDDLAQVLTRSQILRINLAVIRQQLTQGKEIVFSHNPDLADGYFGDEIEYLRNIFHGHPLSFKKEGDLYKFSR